MDASDARHGRSRRDRQGGDATSAPPVDARQLAFPFGEPPVVAPRRPPMRKAAVAGRARRREVPVAPAIARPTAPATPKAQRSADETKLERSLAGHLPPGKTLQLKLTDNRYTMVGVRRAPSGYTVRVHRMFARVEPRLVRALARYVVHNDPRASTMLGDYIEKNKHIIKQQPRRPRNVTIRTEGKHHDLQAIYDRLNEQYFNGTLQARITWGPNMKKRRPRRSIKMGSYAVEDRLIRIHPLLDAASVPGYFVAWIVFHEMLHQKHDVLRDEHGRRCFHPKEFLDEERTFADYDRACAWEKRNIDRLLGS